jgi:hypothetical protein
MKNQMTSALTLENALIDNNKVKIFPDTAGNNDLVGLIFSHNEEPILMNDDDKYFHLDKFSVGCLIDYLKRIYDDMNDFS